MFFSIALLFLLVCTVILILIVLIKQQRLQKDVQNMRATIGELVHQSTAAKHHIQAELLEEKKAHLLLLAYRVRDAVFKQEHAIHAKAIEDAPLSHGMSDEELARMFSPEQAILIEQYWSAYRSYVSTHWTNTDGKIKTIFRGKPDHLESELGQLHHTSTYLVKQFDKWLLKLQ